MAALAVPLDDPALVVALALLTRSSRLILLTGACPTIPGMDRRRLLRTVLAGAVAVPLVARAQQAGKTSRVGLVGLTGPGSMSLPTYQALQGRLGELGWAEGKNLVFEGRWAEGQVERWRPPGRSVQVV